MTTLISLLRDAQAEIQSLQDIIRRLEPRATAFDLLVHTHLGSWDGGGALRYSPTTSDLTVAIAELEHTAEQASRAFAAQEADKAAKARAKKPRAPRTPKTPEPPTETANGADAEAVDPGASPPDSRRRRGLFAGVGQ